MNSRQFQKELAAKGCRFEAQKGGSGHLNVYLGDKRSVMPMHGGRRQLGTGLINKILKDLGLKR
jgi:mRNA interferase HicA